MPSVIDRNHIGVNGILSLGILNSGYVPRLSLELGNVLNFMKSQNHFVKKKLSVSLPSVMEVIFVTKFLQTSITLGVQDRSLSQTVQLNS